MLPFCTPLKHQKNFEPLLQKNNGCGRRKTLTFSNGIKMKHWPEMD